MDYVESEFTAILTKGNQIVPHMRKEISSIVAFLKEIDWTEPWLICLLGFHVLVTTVTIVTRHHGNFQGAFFFTLLLLVFGASSINEIAASNWKYFSRQQYFDSSGMFISLVFSSPLLLNCVIMVGHWLWTSGTLMIKVKQAELRQRIRAESRLKKERKASASQKKDE